MSGSRFMQHYGLNQTWGQDSSEASYSAFKEVSAGKVANFELVPSGGSYEPVWSIPYLQPITMRADGDTQLCIMCPSSDMLVFIEGRGLAMLRQKISERRVAAIYQHDADQHGQVAHGVPVVTNIRVERRGE